MPLGNLACGIETSGGDTRRCCRRGTVLPWDNLEIFFPSRELPSIVPAMNVAEQEATEIQPCYEVAWGKLKEKRKTKKKALCDTEKSSSHPPSSQNKAKQSMPEPPLRKQLWQVGHKKAATSPHGSCLLAVFLPIPRVTCFLLGWQVVFVSLL